MVGPGWMHHPQPQHLALASLFKKRVVLFFLQRPLWLGSLTTRFSWPQEDSMIGPLRKRGTQVG